MTRTPEQLLEDVAKALPEVAAPETRLASVEPALAAAHVEDRLRGALVHFLNGNFSARPYGPGDLGRRPDALLMREMQSLAALIGRANDAHGLFGASTREGASLTKGGRADLTEIARFFSVFYAEFGEWAEGQSGRAETFKSAPPLPADFAKSGQDSLDPISRLVARIESDIAPFAEAVFLDGSLGTCDFIPGWSDVDILLIVGKETVLEPRRLTALRRRLRDSLRHFCAFDPLQLHGYMVMCAFDLDWYGDSYFPLSLLPWCRTVHARREAMDARRRQEDPFMFLRAFWNNAVRYFLEIDGHCPGRVRDRRDLRRLKLFVHRLLTFPLFYLQTKGTCVYKRESFEMAKPDFPAAVWEIVERASEFRMRFADIEPVSDPSFFSSLLPTPLFVRAREIQAYRSADQLAAFRSLESAWPEWRKRAIELAMTGWDLAAEGMH